MKKGILISLLVLCGVILFSCKTEEEKAQQVCEKYIREKVLRSKTTITIVSFSMLNAEQIKKEFLDREIFVTIKCVNHSYATLQVVKNASVSDLPDLLKPDKLKRTIHEYSVKMQDIERFWINTQNRLNDGSYSYYQIEYEKINKDNIHTPTTKYLVVENATKKVCELSQMFDNEKSYTSFESNAASPSIEEDLAAIQEIYDSLK